MALGPGKYDDMAEFIRAKTEARGVLLIVMGGSLGDGVSGKVDARWNGLMPAFLRVIADEMERNHADAVKIIKEGRG